MMNLVAFLALGATTVQAFVTPNIQRSFITVREASSRPAIDWVKQEPLDSLLPKDDVRAIISELLSDKALIDDSEGLVSRNWDSLEAKLRNETRSVQEFLGTDTTDRILDAVSSLNSYDPQAVQAFLSSDAITNLFSRVLYDGIFEFFQKIDVFGQIVNGLPIIGPIRKQIVQETKKQLDRSLGPLVQNFLATYTKIAVKQASEYVLSPSNAKAFGGANVKLASSILERPVNSLLPSSDMSKELQTSLFEYLRTVEPKDFDEYIEFAYDYAGDKALDRLVDVNRVVDASPTLEKTLDRLWTRGVEAQENSSA
mmetsp:Transcript_21078/g.34883  ORF Transcript_21078/g.34883 Transcript_21078/m.34883 type:complete len:312 (-) Transcript_21078:94-1029(-)|eukprot:CAMPEP_0119023028 /NCGR_PEP_ID=MMETSP1176-20130426/29225_1 /TAXON_ID=265551 /ORGANISM="Synedropsis recta cf, Strain CCMP1620" /LENGTH=311 /DNA_ID=CAMNT_0006978011 /DNA_START=55 /DNA_END=990 /DNA_ORIENTATION=+